MTSEQIDRTVGTQGPETPAVAEPEQSPRDIAAPATDSQARLARVVRPVSAVRKPVSGVLTVARRSVTFTRRGTAKLIALVPGTFRTTRDGAQDATIALQALPDPTLRSLAASSVGLGAGFFLAGAPRLVIVAGVVPAVIMGVAMALRPVAPLVPNGADR